MTKNYKTPNGGNKVDTSSSGGKVRNVSNEGTAGAHTSSTPKKGRTLMQIIKGKK